MTSIRIGDDDGILYLFPKEREEGSPVVIVDGPNPVFAAGGHQYFIPYLFGACADQNVRTALYEYLKSGLLALAIEALEAESWAKAASFIAAIAEADAYRVLKFKAP